MKSEKTALKAINYLEMALGDYKAARILLREGLLEQGASLAATAVEKELKALLAMKNITIKKHISLSLLSIAAKEFPELDHILNKNFIKYLGVCFDIRYAKTTSPGFSIILNKNKIIYWLDKTMLDIDSGFLFKINENKLPTPLQNAVTNNCKNILSDNVFLKNINIKEFLLINNKIVELKIGRNLESIMVSYETYGSDISGDFLLKTDLDFGKSEFQLSLR